MELNIRAFRNQDSCLSEPRFVPFGTQLVFWPLFYMAEMAVFEVGNILRR